MKPNKTIIITAGMFVLFGLIILGIAIPKLYISSASSLKTQEYTVTENISKIEISADRSDVHIVSADTDKISLSYNTDDINQYDITASNGILYMKNAFSKRDVLKWYDYFFSIDFNEYDITVSIPKGLAVDIQAATAYGEIKAFGVTGNELSVTTDYGDIEVSECGFISAECSTDYGDIEVSRISGGNISLVTDYGDIEGTILGNETDYTIDADTNLGDNNLQSRTGGINRLSAKTDCGDISVRFIRAAGM